MAEHRYTERQGEYLSFIHYYTRVTGQPPAQTDIQRFFAVTPPTAHNMVVELERRGLIERTPRAARSLRVLLPADQIPPLPDGAHANRSDPL